MITSTFLLFGEMRLEVGVLQVFQMISIKWGTVMETDSSSNTETLVLHLLAIEVGGKEYFEGGNLEMGQ